MEDPQPTLEDPQEHKTPTRGRHLVPPRLRPQPTLEDPQPTLEDPQPTLENFQPTEDPQPTLEDPNRPWRTPKNTRRQREAAMSSRRHV